MFNHNSHRSRYEFMKLIFSESLCLNLKNKSEGTRVNAAESSEIVEIY